MTSRLTLPFWKEKGETVRFGIKENRKNKFWNTFETWEMEENCSFKKIKPTPFQIRNFFPLLEGLWLSSLHLWHSMALVSSKQSHRLISVAVPFDPKEYCKGRVLGGPFYVYSYIANLAKPHMLCIRSLKNWKKPNKPTCYNECFPF